MEYSTLRCHVFVWSICSSTVYRTLTSLYLKPFLADLSPQSLSCFSPNTAALVFLFYFSHTKSFAPSLESHCLLRHYSFPLSPQIISPHLTSRHLTSLSFPFPSFPPFLLLSSTPTKFSPHHTILHSSGPFAPIKTQDADIVIDVLDMRINRYVLTHVLTPRLYSIFFRIFWPLSSSSIGIFVSHIYLVLMHCTLCHFINTILYSSFISPSSSLLCFIFFFFLCFIIFFFLLCFIIFFFLLYFIIFFFLCFIFFFFLCFIIFFFLCFIFIFIFFLIFMCSPYFICNIIMFLLFSSLLFSSLLFSSFSPSSSPPLP